MPTPLERALARSRRRLPLTAGTAAALERSFEKYNLFLAGGALDEALDQMRAGIDSILNPRQIERPDRVTVDNPRGLVTEGTNLAALRGELLQLLDRYDSRALATTLNIDFKVETAVNVAQGAGRFLEGQTDVEEYPAWELYRAFARRVPRLWRGDEDGKDAALSDGFAGRWYQAAQTANDPDAARVFAETGRMIALKSSGIWQALGDFADGLGNPFPPFAFNSGMEVDGVPRAECIELGLLQPDEQPRGSEFDFANLFATEAAA